MEAVEEEGCVWEQKYQWQYTQYNWWIVRLLCLHICCQEENRSFWWQLPSHNGNVTYFSVKSTTLTAVGPVLRLSCPVSLQTFRECSFIFYFYSKELLSICNGTPAHCKQFWEMSPEAHPVRPLDPSIAPHDLSMWLQTHPLVVHLPIAGLRSVAAAKLSLRGASLPYGHCPLPIPQSRVKQDWSKGTLELVWAWDLCWI